MKISRIRPPAFIVIVILFFQLITNSCSTGPAANEAKPGMAVKKVSQPQLFKIEINHMKFEPSELKVKKGDKVVFVNEDMMTHDVTEEKNKDWTSSPLQTGGHWALVVTESVHYFCSLHPVMKGKITVE